MLFYRFYRFLDVFCHFCQNFAIFAKILGFLASFIFYRPFLIFCNFLWFFVIFCDFWAKSGQIGQVRACPGNLDINRHIQKIPFMILCYHAKNHPKRSSGFREYPYDPKLWSRIIIQNHQRSLQNSRFRVFRNTGPLLFERGPFVSSKFPELANSLQQFPRKSLRSKTRIIPESSKITP